MELLPPLPSSNCSDTSKVTIDFPSPASSLRNALITPPGFAESLWLLSLCRESNCDFILCSSTSQSFFKINKLGVVGRTQRCWQWPLAHPQECDDALGRASPTGLSENLCLDGSQSLSAALCGLPKGEASCPGNARAAASDLIWFCAGACRSWRHLFLLWEQVRLQGGGLKKKEASTCPLGTRLVMLQKKTES